MSSITQIEASQKDVSSLIHAFGYTRTLNHDRSGMRLVLLGTIHDQPGILILERAAFPTSDTDIRNLTGADALTSIATLSTNDIYAWCMASSLPTADLPGPNVKLSLIHPCTPKHVAKYTLQRLRTVRETPEIFRKRIRPLMLRDRELGRLNWVYNILDGKAEQGDVLYRSPPAPETPEAHQFLMLPDLNWDRKTMTSLHLLALPVRRDILSIRDLTKEHVPFLKQLRAEVVQHVIGMYGVAGKGVEGQDELERKEKEKEVGLGEGDLKFYFHYQPTYYHLHIHVVHVMFDGGMSQAVGKGWGLETVITMLEHMADGKGMADLDLVYTVGENHEFWKEVFGPLKVE